jgi:hypothetical protein
MGRPDERSLERPDACALPLHDSVLRIRRGWSESMTAEEPNTALVGAMGHSPTRRSPGELGKPEL